MTDFFANARAAIADRIERFRNRDFLEATMAASALVSMADGKVKLTEANVIDQALDAVHELNIYDPHDAVDLFRHHLDELQTDERAAREEILEIVRKVAGDEEEAHILIKVCIAIGKSDEEFIEAEKMAIREIAAVLGLDPSAIKM